MIRKIKRITIKLNNRTPDKPYRQTWVVLDFPTLGTRCLFHLSEFFFRIFWFKLVTKHPIVVEIYITWGASYFPYLSSTYLSYNQNVNFGALYRNVPKQTTRRRVPNVGKSRTTHVRTTQIWYPLIFIQKKFGRDHDHERYKQMKDS
jgi:hypothetical protein